VLETDEARRQRVVEDKWIRPFALVHDDDLLHETLEKLQRRGAHMARVVDAAGTTLGVATLEDVIEELVGEIRDSAHLEWPTPRNGGAGGGGTRGTDG
jgi:CBS domain containing-hemolysin-like protein